MLRCQNGTTSAPRVGVTSVQLTLREALERDHMLNLLDGTFCCLPVSHLSQRSSDTATLHSRQVLRKRAHHSGGTGFR